MADAVRVLLTQPDGPMTLDVSSWQVSRELATNLPDQVRLVTGRSAATARVEVAAPADTRPGWWSPWRRDVTWVGAPITIDVWHDGAWHRRFTGRVMQAGQRSAQDSTVLLDCVDAATDLSVDVSLPAVVDVVRAGMAPGVHPLWALDALLAGARSGHEIVPAPQDGCVIAASWLGSLHGTVGVTMLSGEGTEPPASEPPSWRTTWWGLAPEVAHASYWPVEEGRALRFWGQPGVTRIEALVDLEASDPTGWARVSLTHDATVDEQTVVWRIELQIDADGTVTASSSIDGTDTYDEIVLGPISSGPFAVDLANTAAGVLAVTVVHPGGQQDGQLPFPTAPWGPRLPVWRVDGLMAGAWRVTEDPDSPADVSWQPNVDVSPPLGRLTAVPAVTSRVVWEVIRELVEAELGGVWLDADGHLVVRNRQDLQGVGQTPVPVTSAESLIDLGWVETVEQTAATVEVPVADLDIVRAASGPTYSDGVEVWAAGNVIRIEPFERRSMIVSLSSPAVGLAVDVTATASKDGTGEVIWLSPDRIGAQVRPLGPDRAVIDLINRTGDRWWLVVPETPLEHQGDARPGAPWLRVVASATYSSSGSRWVRRDIDRPLTTRTLSVDVNRWRQDDQAADALARFLSHQIARPQPQMQTVHLVPSPDVQLGRLVEVSDPHVTGVATRALVAGVRDEGDATGWRQEATLRPLLATLADLDAAWSGSTLMDLDAAWAGTSLSELDQAWAARTLEVM